MRDGGTRAGKERIAIDFNTRTHESTYTLVFLVAFNHICCAPYKVDKRKVRRANETPTEVHDLSFSALHRSRCSPFVSPAQKLLGEFTIFFASLIRR